MVVQDRVDFAQELKRLVLESCVRHRRELGLSSVIFSRNCEIEACRKDCPILGEVKEKLAFSVRR